MEALQEAKGNLEAERVGKSLETLLNVHGYNFQYAVLRRLEELYNEKKSPWQFEGAELPVGAGSDVTHIDFVSTYYRQYNSRDTQFILAAECKRVDPAKGYWCFSKAPRTWGGLHREEHIQFDAFRHSAETNAYSGVAKSTYSRDPIYGLPFEVKTGEKGDGIGSADKSAIKTAITQIFRGTSGLARYYSNPESKHELTSDVDYVIIPVIFTTAKIFVTDADISSADLSDGLLSTDSVKVEEKEWIWLNHHRSVHLSNGLPMMPPTDTYQDKYFLDFSRSVAIVNPSGIENFVQTRWDDRIR